MVTTPQRLIRQVSTRLATLLSRSYQESEPPPTATPEEDAQRLQDLRTRAETLSQDLLAEEEPHYPPNEANILRLELAYSDEHRSNLVATTARPGRREQDHDA